MYKQIVLTIIGYCLWWLPLAAQTAKPCPHPNAQAAINLHEQSKVAFGQGKVDSAIVYTLKAKELYKEMACWSSAVHMLRNLVTVYSQLKQPQKLQTALNEGIQIANQHLADSAIEKGKIYTVRGQIDMSLGRLDSAKYYLENALTFVENAKVWTYYVNINRELARLSYYQQDFEAMEPYLDQGYECTRTKLDGDKRQIQALLQLYGALYYRTGSYEKALEKNIDGLEIVLQDMTTRTDSVLVASFYNNIGLLYIEIGDIYNAEDYCINALTFSKKLKDNYKAATIYLNLGEFFKLKGQPQKAYNYYLKGLDILKYAKNKPVGEINRSYINFNNGIGEVAVDIGSNRSAFDALMRNLEIHKKESFKQEETYRILGMYYYKQGAYEQALGYYKKSLQTNQKIYGKKHPLVAQANVDLAEAYGKLGQTETALKALQDANDALKLKEALMLSERPEIVMVSDREVMLRLLEVKAGLLAKEGAILRAYSAVQNALVLIEEMRRGFQAEGSKLFVVQKMIPAYELAIKLALELNKEKGTEQYLNDAFALVEKSKAMLLLEALKTEQARNFGDVPETLLIEEKRLAREIAKQEKKLFEAELASDKRKIEQVQQALLRLRRASAKLQDDLESSYPRYYELKYKEKLAALSQVQESLDADAGLIEFFVGNKQTYIFCIYPDTTFVHQVPVNKKNNLLINSLRANIANFTVVMNSPEVAYRELTQNAYAVFETYLKPCLRKRQNHLTIIPDGLFNYIPVDVLLTQKVDKSNNKEVDFTKLPYMIRDYIIHYEYSASLMLFARQSARTNGKILGMASSYGGKWANEIAKDPHQREIRLGISDLPGARKEVEFLSERYRGNFYFSEESKERNFKRMIRKNKYSVIHLAMHGWVDAERPDYSNLVFTYTGDSLEDDLLHAYELSLLNLNTDLVVLSACETGFGKYERGEGVVSIGRGFMYGGAPSLIMTLWPINDKATTNLIANLYDELEHKVPKDIALRNAKLRYLGEVSKLSGHPFFWASFIMLGDDEPIKIKRQIDWIAWVLYGILGLSLMGIVGLLFVRNKG